ncbi:hypothetical protein A2818_02805 [Candidatus Nomurabacteria bacterium RIFCSPHIGHO2_01_FULL_40_12]|uniref:Uncharacterized protein n=1 Tax=Candidatus Nomurabacteria bacterium RIFCSPHIGHO2_01_FULL_40_12 TaxID=1801737 RepID=A0A1F6V0U4_9BACT|nr:MAG: hypothetical protein A2818_02805 [Candidatus Nomurabacteria bacterium RIFCSPHIGHO2_01_FULL_40_12]
MDLFSTKIAHAGLDSFIGNVGELIINPLIYLLFALAVAYFLYGVAEFILNGDNEEKKTTGKSHMLWGIIGITIMMGVWGILNVLLNTLGIPGSEIDPQSGTVNLNDYNP